MKKLFLITALVMILFGCSENVVVQDNPIDTADSKYNYDAFASCLTTKGLIMYGTVDCIHCVEQIEMFGASFDKVNYFDCGASNRSLKECLDKGIKGTPTWELDDGVLLVGAQPLSVLAGVSNCALPDALD